MAKKRDFDAFYYGVGMKLDQQSIDAVGEQLEGRLNKVVDGVKNNLKSISDAVAKGTKDIDTKGLVSALVEAQKELGNFNDFDPKKLQGQIASLESDFSGLKATLGDVAESIKGFKDLGGFISDIGTRLKSIEVVAPRMGKDALKKDLHDLELIVSGFKDKLSQGQHIDTKELDLYKKSVADYVRKVRLGMASIKASGNPTELFADEELAKQFVKLGPIFRQVGEPLEDLRVSVASLSEEFASFYNKNDLPKVFEETSYQIEIANKKVKQSTVDLERYRKEIDKMNKRRKSTGFDVATEDKGLSFEAKIKKIQEYDDKVVEMDLSDPLANEQYYEILKKQVALANAAEKELIELLKQSDGKKFLSMWQDAFGGYNTDDDKFSTTLLDNYVAQAQEDIELLGKTYAEIFKVIKTNEAELARLMATDQTSKKKPGRPEGTKNKKKKTTDVSAVTDENFTVSPTLKIDKKKWASDINKALAEISNPENNKIKPISLRINTQKTQIEKDLNTIRSAIEKTLGGTRKSKKKDEQDNQLSSYNTAFDKSFAQFMKRLEEVKEKTTKYADETLKPALQEAFKFRVNIDGLDKRNISTEVGSFIDTYIANLNASLEDTPVKLKSNIDELIQEIKTKAQNIEVEGTVGLKAGDISITPQNIGDLNVVVNTSGLAQDDTVQRIYDLLAVRKGGSNPARDARIAELKRLIAEKEGTERATLGVIKAKTSAEEKNISTIVERIEAKNEKTKEPKAVPPTKRKEETTVHLDKAEAVAIVKEAIGGFRGKKDEVKAEAYANLEQKVLDAGNVLHKNIGTLSKTERALYDKLIGLKEAADRVTSTIPKEVADTVTPKEGETSFDKQKIYDDLYKSIGESISTFKDADKALEWVKTEADKFKATLNDTNVGAEELYKAEAGLTILLAKWKTKIGSSKASKEFKYDKNITWGKGSKENWEEYLDNTGLLEGLDNFKSISMKAFQEAHGLIETKGDSRVKATTPRLPKQSEMTPEEQLELYLKNGKELVDFYIQLAKWAKMLSPVADKATKVITEADFADKDVVWHNNTAWTKNNLNKNGQIVIDGKISQADLEQFRIDYETSADDEFKSAFKHVVEAIEGYKESQKRLDKLMQGLESTDIGDQFTDAKNKPEYLAKGIKTSFARIMAKNGSKDAQAILREVLGKHITLQSEFNKLSVSQDPNEMWTSIQNVVSHPEIEKIMTDLGAAKGKTSKNYTNLVNLLKVAKEFMITTNSVDAVGKEAAKAVGGTKETVDRYKKEYDRRTGRYTTTNERVGTKENIIQDGLRQTIKDFGVVFMDKDGNYSSGFNAGGGVVKDYLGANKTYTEIANFLLNALKQAARIQFPNDKKITKDYQGIDIYKPQSKKTETEEKYKPDTERFTASEKLEQGISKLAETQEEVKKNLEAANNDLEKTVGSLEAANNLLEASGKASQTRNEIKTQSNKAERLADEIKTLQNRLTNPGEAFETIETTMLRKREEVLRLNRELSHMPNKTPKDEENRKPIVDAVKKLNNEIESLKSKASYAERSNVENATTALIEQETAEIQKLTADIESKNAQPDVAPKIQRATEIVSAREKLSAEIAKLKISHADIKPTEFSAEQQQVLDKIAEDTPKLQSELAGLEETVKKLEEQNKGKPKNSDEVKANAVLISDANKRMFDIKKSLRNMTIKAEKIRETPESFTSEQVAKQKEITDKLIALQHQEAELAIEEHTLRDQLAPHTEEIKFLTDIIKFKKEYIEALQNGLEKKQAMPTAEAIEAQKNAKSNELSQTQKEQANLEARYAIEQQAVQDVLAPIVESLKVEKAQKEARVSEIGDTQDAKLLEEKKQLETEIIKLDKTINNPSEIINTISQLKQEIAELGARLTRLKDQKDKLENELKTIDKGENYAPDVYDKAVKDLPKAQAALAQEKTQLAKLEHEFDSDINYVKTKIEEDGKKNGLDVKDINALKNSLVKVAQLNQQLTEGKITEEEYVNKVTEAYVKQYKLGKLASEEQARADAKAIIDSKKKAMAIEKDVAKIERVVGSKTAKPDVVVDDYKDITTTNAMGAAGQITKVEQQHTEEKKKQLDLLNQSDVIFAANKKSAYELWQAYRLMNQEIEKGQRVFREYSFTLREGIVTDVARGLIASVDGTMRKTDDTQGHFHPEESLFSSVDISNIKQAREFNPNYNTDILYTPEYVHKITGLKNASIAAIDNLQKQFAEIESLSLAPVIDRALKENALARFANENAGVSYSQEAIDYDTGSREDVTHTITLFEQDVIEQIKQWAKTKKKIFSLKKAGLVGSSDYNNLLSQEQEQRAVLMQNESFASMYDNSYDKKIELTKARDKKYQSASLIQTAIDFDFNLSLFVEQFKEYFAQMDKLGETVPQSSPLAKVRAYIEAIDATADEIQKNALIEQMKPYVLDVFKKNAKGIIDERDKQILWKIAERDKTGRMSEVLNSTRDESAFSMHASRSSEYDSLESELAALLAERDAEEVDPRFATVEKQNEIIEILKSGIKVNGKITAEKNTVDEATSEGGETKETTTKEKKKKVPKIPTVGKVDIQSDEIKNLKDIDQSWDIYKSYISAKEQLDNALADAKEKGADFTVEDADKIRAIKTEVLNLGKGIISASEQFTTLKNRSEDATNSVKIGTTDVKNDMLQLAQDRAIADKALITDISFDEAKQRMTAVLTDMNGQTTRLTMNYYEMFDAIVTSSDKTTDSVRKIYKAIEGEMQRFTEAKNLTDDVFGKPILKQSEEYKKYFAAYNKMLESANTIRDKGALATEDEKNELIALRKEVETTYQAFAKMAKASAEFDAKVGDNVVAMNGTQSLEEQMKAFVLNSQDWTNHQRQMIEESWKFSEAQNSASYAVEKNKGQLASMSVIADMGGRRIGQYTEETKKYKSGMEKFLDSLKNKWQEVARYLLTFGSMYRVFAMLKQGVMYVKEIDSALTELKKVTDETEESYDSFLKTAAKTADKVGSTIKEIVSSTADWARIGYSLEDAATLAESTAVLLNVSEFQSIDEATSALTSTLQAFSYTAEQSMDVVDVLNAVGNSFAVSSDGLATALKDSASSLVAANNTYEEAVALVASANKVVQDPGSVGAALRTISLRLRSTSTKELEEAGEDATGAITSKSKLQGKVKGLTGVDILTDTGAYRSTYDILLDISKVWKDMSDIDQAALLEIIAGKTRSNTAAAILSNTKDLEEALATAQNAEGKLHCPNAQKCA